MTHREWGWLGFVLCALVAARAADPDSVGSPAAPFVAVVMTMAALAIGGWLLLDRHHAHRPHHR